MVTIHKHVFWRVLIPVLLGYAGCVSMPRTEKPQFTQRHYTYSVLLAPETPGSSPQLELALSLIHMEYPAFQAETFHNMLYSQFSLDDYRDFIVNEQRKIYREKADGLDHNWRYTERFTIKQTYGRGLILERVLETYTGGAHAATNTRYYNINMSNLMPLALNDLFANFQEDPHFREIVYEKLREYDHLPSGQPLSKGIYFSDEPELTFNFFLTKDGLCLHWDPYQIAPYVNGSITIVLPWEQIRPLMLYTGVEMLSNFDIYLFDQ